MLKKDIKLIYWLICLIIYSSCSNNNNNKINNEALASNIYIQNNFKKYSTIYETINDSITFYLDSKLAEFTPQYMYGWVVDSMVCINSTGDKLIALTIETKGAGKDYLGDDAMGLLGKKINGKWYFFGGAGTLTIPRSAYGNSEQNPPSQFFLSQIARKEFLESALIKNDKGEYIVNDKWVDAHFYYNGMCGHCKTKEQYDSTHWYKIIHKWKEKIDTNEYKPLHRNKMNSPAI